MCSPADWMALIHKKRPAKENAAERSVKSAARFLGRTEYVCATVTEFFFGGALTEGKRRTLFFHFKRMAMGFLL